MGGGRGWDDKHPLVASVPSFSAMMLGIRAHKPCPKYAPCGFFTRNRGCVHVDLTKPIPVVDQILPHIFDPRPIQGVPSSGVPVLGGFPFHGGFPFGPQKLSTIPSHQLSREVNKPSFQEESRRSTVMGAGEGGEGEGAQLSPYEALSNLGRRLIWAPPLPPPEAPRDTGVSREGKQFDARVRGLGAVHLPGQPFDVTIHLSAEGPPVARRGLEGQPLRGISRPGNMTT